jgi:hypothetical protein
MASSNAHLEVMPVKDDTERQIPSAWRSTFREIVQCFVRGDYGLSAGVRCVAPVAEDTAAQIAGYINRYGETLVERPDETWKTSVCIWTGRNWDVLIDLWTVYEGRSDMVLKAFVWDIADEYLVGVYMVYVP